MQSLEGLEALGFRVSRGLRGFNVGPASVCAPDPPRRTVAACSRLVCTVRGFYMILHREVFV